ncbi:hypothetical protein LEP1GSC034_3830 [Leptospira interrogans str. 2003000735]|uniref:Uncharacterized protein n=2 Tax=Leptospira interrogans TaxID=173 RepID=A0A829D7E7_LEPIR|nr:hypothetical protein LEP1GSC027_2906 [Leptospira interrogans str. 2002000624]EKQ39112.1 hypothetical protein LEP1GSC025_1007 [Leptospira interrogans str. 2002000621]EKQ46405.1 hypothetical protein LEP1GSC026_1164 [Leptospira interrogans str. 2002000623]EMJ72590.1 hypothetical protein LEP1GSC034_3830 [Leptospira interrogans str. 2003000735]EMJ75873.1 hypothetical protein LEP1GSC033_3057 [Leptospira interrogans str. 2002000632]EMJ85271.1 hypothetical protein LEP1GSC032_0379 [Leptospira interr
MNLEIEFLIFPEFRVENEIFFRLFRFFSEKSMKEVECSKKTL